MKYAEHTDARLRRLIQDSYIMNTDMDSIVNQFDLENK
jgi:hypothetical protein